MKDREDRENYLPMSQPTVAYGEGRFLGRKWLYAWDWHNGMDMHQKECLTEFKGKSSGKFTSRGGLPKETTFSLCSAYVTYFLTFIVLYIFKSLMCHSYFG